MKKQMKIVPCALCLVLSVVAALWTGTAAAESVDYKDPSATEPQYQECTPVNATTESLDADWYAVNENVTIDGTLALKGDVNLILADDATLTIKGGIAGEGYNLTVWGQEDQTGQLIVTGTNGVNGANVDRPEALKSATAGDGGDGGAAIVCAGLTVKGGIVQATGGNGGRGGTVDSGRVTPGMLDVDPWIVNGGNGGKGGFAVIGSVAFVSGCLEVQGGAGGQGGNGAEGGSSFAISTGVSLKGRDGTDGAGAMAFDRQPTVGEDFLYVFVGASSDVGTIQSDTEDWRSWTYARFGSVVPKEAMTVDYVDAFGISCPAESCVLLRGGEFDRLEAGWYAVSGSGATYTLGLEFTGDVNLILVDGATLTVNGSIVGAGHNLTVWGQSGQTGKLVVNGTNGGDDAVVEKLVAPSKEFMMFITRLKTQAPALYDQFIASYEPEVVHVSYGGADGGAGITCAELTINGGKVQATGGNGGRGSDGSNGRAGNDAWEHGGVCENVCGGNGGSGGDGGDGGAGAAAVVCSQCVLRGGELSAQAGFGGAGGAGGNGGNGGRGLTSDSYSLMVAGSIPDGGNGGNGGAAGDGGNGGTGIVGSVVVYGGSVSSANGTAGTAGTAGTGGAAGAGGEYNRTSYPGAPVHETGRSGNYGFGGRAGTAGMAGTALSDEPELVAFKSVTADGVDWDLKTSLNTFATVAIVGGQSEPGTPGNKWEIGGAGEDAAMTAYIQNGELVIEGTGAMKNFTLDDPAPWKDQVGSVTAITVQAGITKIGKNAFVGIGDEVPVNGFPSSFFRMMGEAYGQVAGIAARPVTVEVVDGAVKIGVSVRQTDDISAKPEDWPKVDLSKVTVEKNGDRIILTIPVSAAQGFFQLGTGAE